MKTPFGDVGLSISNSILDLLLKRLGSDLALTAAGCGVLSEETLQCCMTLVGGPFNFLSWLFPKKT